MLEARLSMDLLSLGTYPPAHRATSWQGPCSPGSTLSHKDTDVQPHHTAVLADTFTAGGSTSVSPHRYVHSEHVLLPRPPEAFMCSEEWGQDTW